jgi:hypothetical protein
LSATESYEQAELDLIALTGIRVGHSQLHRLVQQTAFVDLDVEETITEISLDGGKVRVRTPKGEPSGGTIKLTISSFRQTNFARLARSRGIHSQAD